MSAPHCINSDNGDGGAEFGEGAPTDRGVRSGGRPAYPSQVLSLSEGGPDEAGGEVGYLYLYHDGGLLPLRLLLALLRLSLAPGHLEVQGRGTQVLLLPETRRYALILLTTLRTLIHEAMT